MGTLTATALQPSSSLVTIPINELNHRVIQHYEATYTGGEWNPDNSYNWAPGSWVDFTPRRADSRIKYMWRAPHAWVAAAHGISHWKFMANNSTYFWHTVAGYHQEDGATVKWDIPTWGLAAGRIGYMIRSYANDNHEFRLNTTYYWDGTGRSAQNARSQLIIEEYVGGSDDNWLSSNQQFVAR